MPLRRNTIAVVPSEQGHLDFGAPSFAPGSYVAHSQNERARAALEKWHNWPGGAFCLFGEAGAGKSHLASIWAQDAQACALSGKQLNMLVVGGLTSNKALVDRADESDEMALFALLTNLEARGGAVLLVGRDPPQLWPFALPDLKSRLKAIACETLIAPEVDLLAQLIIRHSAARGFKIDETSSTYLASRIPRTFEAARAISLCMESVSRATLKSPMALAQRALHVFYQQVEPEDDAPI